jgi:hypothetical protein
LLGLPLYGLMTFFSSLDPQPDPNTHYEAFSRFVTTDSYVLKHFFLSDLSIILVIFGIFALGAYLTRSRAGSMGLWAMVIAVFGQGLFLLIGGVSTFATPAEGQAYLAGIEEYHKLPTRLAVTAQTATLGGPWCCSSWATCSWGWRSGARRYCPSGPGPCGRSRPF